MYQYNPDIHHRRSIRLKGYDYSLGGSYFITLCANRKRHLFGHICNGKMHANAAGKMIQTAWNDIPRFYEGFDIDVFQLMPNHLHGIIRIVGAGFHACPGTNVICAGGQSHGNAKGQPRGVAPTVGRIIGLFKSFTTKRYLDMMQNNNAGPAGKLWQRNYYEHIIRDEPDYYQIREYIISNPQHWDKDELYG